MLEKKIKTLKSINLSQSLRPYENKWVALSLNHKKILGAGDTLKEAEEEARRKSEKYIFLRLPPFDVQYVPRQC